MSEIVRTKIIGIQMVIELTGDIAGMEDMTPINRKYTLAILVYCKSKASEDKIRFTDKKVIPRVL